MCVFVCVRTYPQGKAFESSHRQTKSRQPGGFNYDSGSLCPMWLPQSRAENYSGADQKYRKEETEG